MSKILFGWVVVLGFIGESIASTLYVDLNSVNPVAPYADWSTAATNIQDAVDAASAADLVLVTNGVYDTGNRVTPGYACLNRVVITNNITLRSVNGPEDTFIKGAEATGGGNGTNAVRCVYMGAGTLSGFTLTNGYTRKSGNLGYDLSGGGVNGYGGNTVVSNCVLSANSAQKYGGGCYAGILDNCTLAGNSSENAGGGSSHGTLSNCMFSGNSADYGGGSSFGTLNNCTLFGNSAYRGGGSYYGTLNNCNLTGNSATKYGGGSSDSTLRNCIVYFNKVDSLRSNYHGGTLNYCCTTPAPSGGTGNITNNPALLSSSHIRVDSPCVGSGSDSYSSGTDIDGDVWGSPPSIGCDEPTVPFDGELNVSITAQSSNIGLEQVVSFLADIQGESSSNRWTFGDGTSLSNAFYDVSHAWASPGEYSVVLTVWNHDNPGGVSASTQVNVIGYYVDISNPSPIFPYTSWTTAATTIQDAVDAASANNMVLVKDGVYDTGSSVTPGYASLNRVVITNNITVRSVNGPEVTVIKGANTIRCAYLGEGTLSGFTITNGHAMTTGGNSYYDQSGGGVNGYGGSAIVSNCVISGNWASQYDGGGSYFCTLNNCIIIGNSASRGGGMGKGIANSCTFIDNSAYFGGGMHDGTANNCIFTGNLAQEGGGIGGGTANNCIATDNSAQLNGGGIHAGAAKNCIFFDNSAGYSGGGSYGASLNNCTLSGNSSIQGGGGLYGGVVKNCIVWYNTSNSGEDNIAYYPTGLVEIYYTCSSSSRITHGVSGCITNAPIFVDSPNENFRLRINSPCINKGNNSYAPGLTDLEENPRIVGTFVDMGTYEYQAGSVDDSDNDGLRDDWEWNYFGGNASPDGNADADGLSNGGEYIAGTDPTNSASYFQVTTDATEVGDEPHFIIEWTAVTGRTYNILWTPSLAQELHPFEIGIEHPQSSYTDTVHNVESKGFYKVDVRMK